MCATRYTLFLKKKIVITFIQNNQLRWGGGGVQGQVSDVIALLFCYQNGLNHLSAHNRWIFIASVVFFLRNIKIIGFPILIFLFKKVLKLRTSPVASIFRHNSGYSLYVCVIAVTYMFDILLNLVFFFSIIMNKNSTGGRESPCSREIHVQICVELNQELNGSGPIS